MNFDFTGMAIPVLLLLGGIIIFSFYFGRSVKLIKLPTIIGYMILGVILGPSFLNLLNEQLQAQFAFIPEIALSFVALSIGLELNFVALRKLGIGILYIIMFESFGALLLVSGGLYLLTHDITLSLIFGAIAPASAPAGTVAIIQEYKARGSLTQTLYAVVGFDDGLGIMIFGIVAAFARIVLMKEVGEVSESLASMILHPLQEIFLSFFVGIVIAVILTFLARKLKNSDDILILIFGFTFVSTGLCTIFHLSLILTNMIIGMVVINTQPHALIQKIHDRLPIIMPLLFILFFTLAGSNLHINLLPSLGLLGIIYILTRSGGLIIGSRIGAILGKTEKKIKNYVGMGILSQAGVAIGLSLIVRHEFKGLGKVVETVNGQSITSGDKLGIMVLTTVTATCIFFEIIGPILTKIALKKAGEIS